ncbi:MAG TPA: glycosyltransferase [Planctomycetaceae bacterium]|nr:glycosyltransferase [Planctomycetaceae bacterium]
MLSRVTFGITAFERPRLLEQLVASILARYPGARIMVADNGRRKARLPARVKALDLPFDSGLSRARNALVENLETEFLLLLEEDFLFTDETRIESLFEVLRHDDEVGVAGGALRGPTGRVVAYSMDLESFRRTLFVRETAHRVRVTPSGTPYRLCDMIWNFALFRREMLHQHRWDERLKLGEHTPYYHQVKLTGRWRVACCPSVVCSHLSGGRSGEYTRHRQRARKFFESYLRDQGFDSYQRLPQIGYVDELLDKPSVVVLGVGHSGTSILAKMLHSAGWEPADADQEFGESVRVRELNEQILTSGRLHRQPARRLLDSFPEPWAVKDPRFVATLRHWLPHFADLRRPPLLMRIVREPQHVAPSYLRRGFRGDLRQMLDLSFRLCREQYDLWPWQKLTLDYERLGQASGMFVARAAAMTAAADPEQAPREVLMATRSATVDQESAVEDLWGLETDSRDGGSPSARMAPDSEWWSW